MRSNGNSNSASNFVSFTERLKSFSKKSPKWPHPETFLANPNSLAAAGFYFSPSNDNKDAVSCFICQKGLADWDPTDDPAAIHFDKCSTCPWATLKCISDGPDGEGRYNFPSSRIPTSKEMEKARLETFAPGGKSWWPQDGRNKGPSSKLMAKAGFIFTPVSSKKDDTCSCIYCGIELSGWQADDDPMEEHCRRQDKNGPCPFFTVQEAPAKSQQNSKTNNTLSKRNTSSRSKSKHKSTPSLTIQSVTEEENADVPPPSSITQPTIEEEEPPPPPPQPKKTKTTTSKPKAKAKAKSKAKPKSPPLETTSENTPPVSSAKTNRAKQSVLEEIPKPSGREEEEGPEMELEPEPDSESRPAAIPVQEQRQQHQQQSEPEPEPEIDPEIDPELKNEPHSRPQQDQELETDLELKEEQQQAPLTPPLTSVSIPPPETLTEAERLMTVEEWIRAEMQRQYELFEAHGRSRIEAFKVQAAEVAERIQQL